MSATKTETIETPVGKRTIPKGTDWYKGEGRGFQREFISKSHKMKCEGACGETLPETAFPTLSVPRKDGRTRAKECRKDRDARLARAAKAKTRARNAAKTRKAKATPKRTTTRKAA